MSKMVYIVMCSTIMNGDIPYYIDSVWTDARKADKRKNYLNSEKNSEWRDEHGLGMFSVEYEVISRSSANLKDLNKMG